jgi:TRAP-type transport system periplasmic protein
MVPLKAYEVSKYYSLTGHNYGSTLTVMNLGVWNGLTPAQQKLVLDVGREAQGRSREAMESVDSEASAKSQLEPLGMQVNAPNREPFHKLAIEKVWPAYQKQYSELWDQIVAIKA